MPQWEDGTMKTYVTVSAAMLVGMAIGGFAVQGLHAQAKPPIYYVAEIDTANLDAYMKDYAPLAQASIKAAGGRIVAGGQAKAVEGEPPKAARVVIQVWDNEEQIQKWRSSADYKKAREIGDKLAKFRSFTALPAWPSNRPRDESILGKPPQWRPLFSAHMRAVLIEYA